MDFWKGEIATGKDSTTKAALGWMRVDGLNGRERSVSYFLLFFSPIALVLLCGIIRGRLLELHRF